MRIHKLIAAGLLLWLCSLTASATTTQYIDRLRVGTLQIKTDPVIDAAAYGVLCDGSTDDSTAFATALTAATGGTLMVPSGTCMLGTALTIPANTRLIGQGMFQSTLKRVATANVNLLGAGDNVEIAYLGLDGNGTVNVAANTDPDLFAVAQIDDLYIHDCYFTKAIDIGLSINAVSGASNRIRVINNYFYDMGWKAAELRDIHDFVIANNTFITSGSDSLSVTMRSAATANTTFSSRGVISGNHMNRATAPTAIKPTNTETGFFINFGDGAEDITVTGNTLWDNQRAAQDAIGQSASSSALHLNRGINIIGNHISYAGQFAIDVSSDSVTSGNYVYRPDTHGIVVAYDFVADYDNVIISNNVIVDVNDDNTSNIYAIQVNPTFSADSSMRNLVVNGNICRDSRARTAACLNLATSSGEPITNVTVVGNNFEGGTLGIRWFGTDFTQIRVRDNIMPTADPYRGIAYLTNTGAAGGTTAGTYTVTNSGWPDLAGIRFTCNRVDLNSATAVGSLNCAYNGSTAVVITSYDSAAAVATNDKSGVVWEFIGTVD